MCRLAAHVQQIQSQEDKPSLQAAIDRGLGILNIKELEIPADLTKKMQSHDMDIVKRHLTTELVIVDDPPRPSTHRETPQPLGSGPDGGPGSPEDKEEAEDNPRPRRSKMWPMGLAPGHSFLPG